MLSVAKDPATVSPPNPPVPIRFPHPLRPNQLQRRLTRHANQVLQPATPTPSTTTKITASESTADPGNLTIHTRRFAAAAQAVAPGFSPALSPPNAQLQYNHHLHKRP
jgi:hypothetical protein